MTNAVKVGKIPIDIDVKKIPSDKRVEYPYAPIYNYGYGLHFPCFGRNRNYENEWDRVIWQVTFYRKHYAQIILALYKGDVLDARIQFSYDMRGYKFNQFDKSDKIYGDFILSVINEYYNENNFFSYEVGHKFKRQIHCGHQIVRELLQYFRDVNALEDKKHLEMKQILAQQEKEMAAMDVLTEIVETSPEQTHKTAKRSGSVGSADYEPSYEPSAEISIPSSTTSGKKRAEGTYTQESWERKRHIRTYRDKDGKVTKVVEILATTVHRSKKLLKKTTN